MPRARGRGDRKQGSRTGHGHQSAGRQRPSAATNCVLARSVPSDAAVGGARPAHQQGRCAAWMVPSSLAPVSTRWQCPSAVASIHQCESRASDSRISLLPRTGEGPGPRATVMTFIIRGISTVMAVSGSCWANFREIAKASAAPVVVLACAAICRGTTLAPCNASAAAFWRPGGAPDSACQSSSRPRAADRRGTTRCSRRDFFRLLRSVWLLRWPLPHPQRPIRRKRWT
ncbi:MAG: hypothetical protein AW08_01301 [Candidatus Accumulibacter adjunctus]|uniref:Uncharacterized protein n=1 Tax=Candidatus Accumulibacter adjunctus TaxID=1454001 RepID=A0A011PP58_9PROT|nr:MAG: hypothetical protein AW08_01301 [Candidatus Accumulibacter adjunctus]